MDIKRTELHVSIEPCADGTCICNVGLEGKGIELIRMLGIAINSIAAQTKVTAECIATVALISAKHDGSDGSAPRALDTPHNPGNQNGSTRRWTDHA